MDCKTLEQLEVIKEIFQSKGVTAEMLKEELKNKDSLERFEIETQEMIKLLSNAWE